MCASARWDAIGLVKVTAGEAAAGGAGSTVASRTHSAASHRQEREERRGMVVSPFLLVGADVDGPSGHGEPSTSEGAGPLSGRTCRCAGSRKRAAARPVVTGVRGLPVR